LDVLVAHGYESPGEVENRKHREEILKDMRAIYLATQSPQQKAGSKKAGEPAFSAFGAK
jgi:L-rhamnose isomerase